ncbi:hypothetical protein ABOM_012146 [Aspergillus bombycis]|uniref:F-box domain-containing protein n=1 Tax=Aspergillus bombycis TaxID=109264 RepID=A0A1F7ZIM0_9EURO|nr:hypothetical protein ABOM_012146 [Aspergillus bombycis]OGM39290.1 hypothetical protein ABOM_012146 [Aspergillus bombycis]
MESTRAAQVGIHSLPIELLTIIVQMGEIKYSLKSLSQVNKAFRQLCAPLLFNTLRITSSTAGLSYLTQASQSPIRSLVKTIRYEVSELIDPLTQNWDTFRACIYPVSEYTRDRKERWSTLGGRDVSYSTVYSYFCTRSQEQHAIIRSDHDTTVLCASLPSFPHLNTILLRFSSNIKQPFRWLADRVLLDGQVSFPDHVRKVATAIKSAKESGISIQIFIISGFYPRFLPEKLHEPNLLKDALTDIQELRVEDSPSLLGFFARSPLPSLRRFELGSYWMSVAELKEFVYAHANTLRYLHLQDIWLLREKGEEGYIDLSLATTETILESIRDIRRSNILQELTMNRQINGICEIRELLR